MLSIRCFFLSIFLYTLLIAEFGCKPCDSDVYKTYIAVNPQPLDSLMEFYRLGNKTLLKSSTDTITVALIKRKTITDPGTKTSSWVTFGGCSNYEYSQYTEYQLGNSNKSLLLTFTHGPKVKIENTHYSTMYESSTKIDTTLNGKRYSGVNYIPMMSSYNNIKGCVIFSDSLGVLSIKTDSLDLVRVP